MKWKGKVKTRNNLTATNTFLKTTVVWTDKKKKKKSSGRRYVSSYYSKRSSILQKILLYFLERKKKTYLYSKKCHFLMSCLAVSACRAGFLEQSQYLLSRQFNISLNWVVVNKAATQWFSIYSSLQGYHSGITACNSNSTFSSLLSTRVHFFN